jgi:hypothetical protein
VIACLAHNLTRWTTLIALPGQTIEEREVMRPLPEREPDLDRRWALRVAPDPHLRFDTNDYSLAPNLVGRRVEVRFAREIIAVALDTGELACRHERVLRAQPDDHRAGARAGAARAPRPARRRRAGRRAAAAVGLRPADRVSRSTSELAHRANAHDIGVQVGLIDHRSASANEPCRISSSHPAVC